jgi:hypothetical protein
MAQNGSNSSAIPRLLEVSPKNNMLEDRFVQRVGARARRLKKYEP